MTPASDTTRTGCPRPGCLGHVMVTGFCDTCDEKAPGGSPTVAAPRPGPRHNNLPGQRRPGREQQGQQRPDAPFANPAADELDVDGVVLLPDIPKPRPADVVSTTAHAPTGSRRCGVDGCTGTIGVGHAGRPAPDHGFCPECGSPYSFKPQLSPGDEIGGHYRVVGYLAAGGLGQVYLAEDTRLKDKYVVLKGLINTHDAAARRNAVEERRSLTTLHHPDIVAIFSHIEHEVPGEEEPTGYIVMEYIGGRPLDSYLFASDEELEGLFGKPFGLDHVLTYGCKILSALEYLHDQGLLYCDMKPENVIQYGHEIKVIDLGAVRPIGDQTSDPVYTREYAPPRRERESRGFHVDTDLYTVGRTLQALATRAAPAKGLAAQSFTRLVARATHQEPAARFTSAAQMSRQLWEVLREYRSLSKHEQYPERSTRFEPVAELIGPGLGSIPTLAHWSARTGPPQDLDIAPPGPREAASGLPLPIPDPQDPSAVLIDGLAADSPDRIAERAKGDRALDTVEVALWLCRAYLEDSGEPKPQDGAAPRRTEAANWLARATELLDPDTAGYDWRLAWHRGLLALAGDEPDLKAAQEMFMATYDTLPGEWAPKLALGYCAEALTVHAKAERALAEQAAAETPPGTPVTDPEVVRIPDPKGTQTVEYYDAVWQRDRTRGSAAFGMARVHLRRGDRAGAVKVLDAIPTTSRHFDAARIAAIRVLAGRLGGTAPTVAQLAQVNARLGQLRLDDVGARDRLVTEIRENVLAGAADSEHPWGAEGLPEGELFEGATTRPALAGLLYQSLRKLADQAVTVEERGELLDRAYDVRPETRF